VLEESSVPADSFHILNRQLLVVAKCYSQWQNDPNKNRNKRMKSCLQIILFFLAVPCFAQPTGHQKIFLEITDNTDTLDFKSCFKKGAVGRKTILEYKNYRLYDLSNNQTGFQLYPKSGFIRKTLMADDHYIQIVKNETDTMNIEIYNAFNIYFLSVPFQKGNYRLYVNDGLEFEWNYTFLPQVTLSSEQMVYNITPKNWKAIEVKQETKEEFYFLINNLNDATIQRLKESIGNKIPALPLSEKIEQADYNCDGMSEFRIKSSVDTTKWDYFIFDKYANTFKLDTFLSSTDWAMPNNMEPCFLYIKYNRIDDLTVQTDVFACKNGGYVLMKRTICSQPYHYAERIDCDFYEANEKGELILIEHRQGAE
jgi:hypothetical protein